MLDMEYPEAIQRLREERLSRANDMRSDGATYAQIGEALGISRQRVHQLLNPAPKVDDPLKGMHLRARTKETRSK